VNTGWTGGAYGTGNRMPIKATRALLTAALDGSLNAGGRIRIPQGSEFRLRGAGQAQKLVNMLPRTSVCRTTLRCSIRASTWSRRRGL
jgi:hypothetical protein